MSIEPADDSVATYYAYIRNGPDTQRPGVVDILRQSHDWTEVVYAAYQHAQHVHAFHQDLGESTTEGWSAVTPFTRLDSLMPCDVFVRSYEYVIGVTNRLPVGSDQMAIDIRAILEMEPNLNIYGEQLSDLVTELVRYVEGDTS